MSIHISARWLICIGLVMFASACVSHAPAPQASQQMGFTSPQAAAAWGPLGLDRRYQSFGRRREASLTVGGRADSAERVRAACAPARRATAGK